jgi:AcrR family transcriptional regulator
MNNSRTLSKLETRQRILTAAKEMLTLNGLLNLSTVDIARQAGVAHGTLFFHFQNKENLLIEVIDQELLKITAELYPLLDQPQKMRDLLNRYLDFLEKEEPFFAVIARETPFYAPELRRTILGREAAVRQYFYRALEADMRNGQIQKLDITSCLNFLFGTLHYYLSLSESFVPQGSVIAEKRASLVETWMKFLE